MWLIEFISFIFGGQDTRYQFGDRNLEKIDKKATKEYYNHPMRRQEKKAILDKLELELLLLRYMLNAEDGKVSLSEKRVIEKHLSRYKVYINQEDLKKLKKLVKEEFTLDTLKLHIDLCDVSDSEINKTFQLLEIINQETNKYGYVIERMKRYFRDN